MARTRARAHPVVCRCCQSDRHDCDRDDPADEAHKGIITAWTLILRANVEQSAAHVILVHRPSETDLLFSEDIGIRWELQSGSLRYRLP